MFNHSKDEAIRKGLPEELQPFFVRPSDTVLPCILCVLEMHLKEIDETGSVMTDYQIPVPYKYVIAKGHRMVKGIPVVDAPYSYELGLEVDEEYEEEAEETEDDNPFAMGAMAVGDVVLPFKGQPEGVRMGIDGTGLTVMVFLDKPTLEEVRQLKVGAPIEFRLWHRRNILLLLLKPDTMNWMEAPYHPQRSRQTVELAPLPPGKGYALTLVLVNTATGRIENLRLTSLPCDTGKALKEAVDMLKTAPFDNEGYRQELQKVFAFSTTDELVRQARSGN